MPNCLNHPKVLLITVTIQAAWRAVTGVEFQSPEGSSYLCNLKSQKVFASADVGLNHPKVLFISVTLIQKFSIVKKFQRFNHPKALLISATHGQFRGSHSSALYVSITRRL